MGQSFWLVSRSLIILDVLLSLLLVLNELLELAGQRIGQHKADAHTTLGLELIKEGLGGEEVLLGEEHGAEGLGAELPRGVEAGDALEELAELGGGAGLRGRGLNRHQRLLGDNTGGVVLLSISLVEDGGLDLLAEVLLAVELRGDLVEVGEGRIGLAGSGSSNVLFVVITSQDALALVAGRLLLGGLDATGGAGGGEALNDVVGGEIDLTRAGLIPAGDAVSNFAIDNDSNIVVTILGFLRNNLLRRFVLLQAEELGEGVLVDEGEAVLDVLDDDNVLLLRLLLALRGGGGGLIAAELFPIVTSHFSSC